MIEREGGGEAVTHFIGNDIVSGNCLNMIYDSLASLQRIISWDQLVVIKNFGFVLFIFHAIVS